MTSLTSPGSWIAEISSLISRTWLQSELFFKNWQMEYARTDQYSLRRKRQQLQAGFSCKEKKGNLQTVASMASVLSELNKIPSSSVEKLDLQNSSIFPFLNPLLPLQSHEWCASERRLQDFLGYTSAQLTCEPSLN